MPSHFAGMEQGLALKLERLHLPVLGSLPFQVSTFSQNWGRGLHFYCSLTAGGRYHSDFQSYPLSFGF